MKTSEAGFTQGPWHYHARLSGSENHRGFRVYGGIYGTPQWVFCEVQPGDEDGREGEANARLIASAPDMLAALQEAADRIDGINGGSVSDTVALMRAAIAKALGA